MAQGKTGKIVQVIGQTNIPVVRAVELNERDYGDLTGMNKWAAREQYGEEQFLRWRRGWDEKIPNGETLKDVYNRVVPYYEREILPKLQADESVLIVAHGNSLRALVKYLDNVPEQEIVELNIPTGIPLVYVLNDALEPLQKFYLGDPETVKRATAAVANQGKART